MKKFTSILLSLLMVISMTVTGAVSVSAADTGNAAVSATPDEAEPAGIVGLEIAEQPRVTQYVVGQDIFDFRSLGGTVLKLIYSDGSEALIDYDDYMDGGHYYFENNVKLMYNGELCTEIEPVQGENIITLVCGDVQAELTVYGIVPVSMKVSGQPEKTQYPVGDTQNITNFLHGLAIDVTFIDGKTVTYEYYDQENGGSTFFHNSVIFSGDNLKNGTYLTPVLGDNIITLICGGASASFTLTGVPATDIEIIQLPDVTRCIAGKYYYLGDITSGLVIAVTYSDGSVVNYFKDYHKDFFKENIKITWQNDNDIVQPGDNTVTVSMGDLSDEYTVYGAEITKMSFIDPPDRTALPAGDDYTANDLLDGSRIRIDYFDGVTERYSYTAGKSSALKSMLSYNGGSLWSSTFSVAEGKNAFTFTCGNASVNLEVEGYEVSNIEVSLSDQNGPFIAGEQYYKSDLLKGAKLKVTYSDGSVKTFDYDNDKSVFDAMSLSGITVNGSYFTPNAGTNWLTLSYEGAETVVSLKALEVASVKVTKQPTGVYAEGERVYLPRLMSGAELTVTLSDGSTLVYNAEDNYSFFSGDISYSGDNISSKYITFALGDNQVFLVYAGKAALINIEVYPLKAMEVVNSTSKNFTAGISYSYYQYTAYLEVKAEFENGESRIYSNDISDDSGFFNNVDISCENFDEDGNFTPVPGENKIILTREGITAEYVINALEPVKLEITRLPDETTFIQYRDLDLYNLEGLDGMEVTVTYSDGTVKTFCVDNDGDSNFFQSEVTFSGDCISFLFGEPYICPEPGENVITLTCGSVSDQFTINGVDVESIEVVDLPTTDFIAGVEYYDWSVYTGMSIRFNYSDGTSKIYYSGDDDMYYYTLSFDSEGMVGMDTFVPKAGENTVTVKYNNLTDEYTVNAREVQSLAITRMPEQSRFIQGKRYMPMDNFDGMEITLKYTDGTTGKYTPENNRSFFWQSVEITGDCIEDAGSMYPKAGANVITVSCGGKSADMVILGAETLDRIAGDVNGDNNCNIRDAAAIQLYKARLYDGYYDESVADVNGDGEVDIKDAAYIQLDLAKLL